VSFGRNVARLLPAIAALVLASCGGEENAAVESLRLERDDFVISLRARGELQAAESTPIRPPPGSRNPRTIAWLAPNYSRVKQGDVVVRFDASEAERGLADMGIEIDKVDIDMLAKQRELERLLAELGNEAELVDIEKAMAEAFNLDNELAYSRFEIIDAMRDKELLDYKSGHLEEKKGVYSDRENAEAAVLTATRATHESKFEEHRSQVENSEVRAPHDGFLVYERSWWGQPIDVGSTVFPGNAVASIPNLGQMEAELRVLETEAVGLAVGQKVDVVVDAYPDRPLTGEVTNVSAAATPIERGSPVKYFTVTVALDQSDPEWITPDALVTGEIRIGEVSDAIAVPNQALFQDDTGEWVLVREGGAYVRRDVTLGLRSANRSEVVSGLAEDDVIALNPPEQAS
jgi:RND family efflux transporter MFP subunit